MPTILTEKLPIAIGTHAEYNVATKRNILYVLTDSPQEIYYGETLVAAAEGGGGEPPDYQLKANKKIHAYGGNTQIIDFTNLFDNFGNAVNASRSLNARFNDQGAISFILSKTSDEVDVTSIGYDQAKREIIITKGDLSTKVTTLPIATTTSDGLMPMSAVTTLNDLVSAVESISEGGTWRATFGTYAEMIAAYPDLDVSATNWLIMA